MPSRDGVNMTKKEKLPESDEQYWVLKEDTKPEEEGDGDGDSEGTYEGNDD